ncbi:YdcH family protein [Luteimonas abyssi]|uniref:YdcH family protein n=1 Tax=Luteimonas abyssi TaxID=1247514 RepID=UPI000737C97B|nr:YdcH family protein [Luteimonas abyssi]
MFEAQPHAEMEAVFQANPDFRRLYHHHQELDKKVMDAELGVLPIDETTLAQMKREKLQAKDRLIKMFDDIQQH